MSSKVISFRLSESELAALEVKQIIEDDSLNQTAARLIREIISSGTASASSSIANEPDSEIWTAINQLREYVGFKASNSQVKEPNEIDQLKEEIETLKLVHQENLELQAAVDLLQAEVNQLKADNHQLQTNASKQSQVNMLPDWEKIRDLVLGKLKLGKQSVAGKALDMFIREIAKALASQTAQLEPSSEIKSTEDLTPKATAYVDKAMDAFK